MAASAIRSGSGPLLEIPVNCESYNLAYLPEVLERTGLELPASWDQYFATARAVVERTDGEVRGFAQRGTAAWHTMYTGFATQLWSYGGRDFVDGRCAIASPASVRATADFLAALRDAGPTELARAALVRARDGLRTRPLRADRRLRPLRRASSRIPRRRELAGRIGYALPPVGPTGERRPNLWTWSVVMNTRATDRDAAWRFVEWATGAEFLLRSTFEGNMNPTRRSIWDDERFRAHTSSWGAFHDVARTLIEHEASVLVTPAPNYIVIATRWVEALLDAYAGRGEIDEVLEAAAADIDALT